jgi:hypothetical protein
VSRRTTALDTKLVSSSAHPTTLDHQPMEVDGHASTGVYASHVPVAHLRYEAPPCLDISFGLAIAHGGGATGSSRKLSLRSRCCHPEEPSEG